MKIKKPTIAGLARYVGQSRQAMHNLRNDNPQKFTLLWDGYIKHLNESASA